MRNLEQEAITVSDRNVILPVYSDSKKKENPMRVKPAEWFRQFFVRCRGSLFWRKAGNPPFAFCTSAYITARRFRAGRSVVVMCDSFRTRIKNHSFSAWGSMVNPLWAGSFGICAFMVGTSPARIFGPYTLVSIPGDIYRRSLEKRAENFSSFLWFLSGFFRFFSGFLWQFHVIREGG